MPALKYAKWMVGSQAVYKVIKERGWRNIPVDHRQQMLDILASDIAAAEKYYEVLSISDQRELLPEIGEAKSALNGLIAGSSIIPDHR